MESRQHRFCAACCPARRSSASRRSTKSSVGPFSQMPPSTWSCPSTRDSRSWQRRSTHCCPPSTLFESAGWRGGKATKIASLVPDQRANLTTNSSRYLFATRPPGDLLRCGLRASGGLFNKLCDGSRLRYIDGVATLDLNDRGARPLGHGTLGVRWNHLVLGGDQVPARLGPPRGFADRAANGPQAPRNLGVGHKRGFFGVYVGRERGGELRLVKKQKTVLRGQYRRYGRAGRWVFDKRPYRLALVRSEGGDVYEG